MSSEGKWLPEGQVITQVEKLIYKGLSIKRYNKQVAYESLPKLYHSSMLTFYQAAQVGQRMT